MKETHRIGGFHHDSVNIEVEFLESAVKKGKINKQKSFLR